MAETFAATPTEAAPDMGEDFAALLAESLGDTAAFEGTVVKGTVVAIENDMALIDVGLKSEGRVALKEFAAPGQPSDLKIGDVVDVYVERLEDKNGEAMLSREKARREEAWTLLEKSLPDNQKVQGVNFGRVKIGRAARRESVREYGSISVGAETLKKKN